MSIDTEEIIVELLYEICDRLRSIDTSLKPEKDPERNPPDEEENR